MPVERILEIPPAVEAAVVAAVNAGQSVRGTTSPNPPVGCALFDAAGIIATGATEPAGGRHAERVALDAAKAADADADRIRGASLAVTLEPCNHTGRTGPCTEAIVNAGVEHVYYVHQDPNPEARGGAGYLRAHGVRVTQVSYPVDGLLPWLDSVVHGRVSVTAKFAGTLDGFTAAPDGTSQWITGPETRQYAHYDRAMRDAIVIGTGTAIADNPSLTARDRDGTLLGNQPRRVVVGKRKVPEGNLTRLGFEQYGTPQEAFDALYATGARDVLVEGGPTLMRSVFELDIVDRITAYVAPVLLGGGRGLLDGPVAETLEAALRFDMHDAFTLGGDAVIELRRPHTQRKDN
ncbi:MULTISPECIES: bifunctional diaminohydroxyphosphoribosylaminopyrimidine deaminase/5-amino-6-(5-phosphoribosylamino)uracil reductase RibD [unclassified Corynebacterium]|uniref:bifunctional diaminohydroxyphosphoribosylaminopyrimidine deaminase/5-amino-6-(5-phosphoribosylamino)uracil reductase RibD n=1 Tax=unclassified Corynebacterium TaxID=2624378 RepID=UPI00264F66A5|nr:MULTISPECIES: bifunctional diaminohydroxyphosphoribosylaminopyrimidine deaminase/5-amino-6-(5-phosphoribosylamino)uracil reductase RibD [unclassified Corynebacterium]MDN8593913.1 bifunctional diaminohydroxyphosphoribosylaminopyrimidine deaminase/5-amino-6-(5-phosphoribosylamino)uracil reductase RibD [Corynebacterium sp. P4_F2]WKK56014.1 bifunctional diaminohydroxyphosphoribosylaminopyrimidine deaminase/5-amino-6-(5-phosphoribosylamino)uracil reductase RibD [Corynebacterium sp. P4-C1]WKK63424.